MENDLQSLRTTPKKSGVGIISRFTGRKNQHRRRASFDAADSFSSAPISHSSPRWSPAWFKSKHHVDHVPEIKGKCRSFISRIGQHSRHASADFSYDPLSYSLNFADDAEVDDDDSRAMSFNARFPSLSSPRSTPSPKSPTYRSSYMSDDRHRKTEAPQKVEVSHLSKGFESLAENLKASREMTKDHPQRRNKSGLSPPSPRETETSEEGTSPIGISQNREILVQMC